MQIKFSMRSLLKTVRGRGIESANLSLAPFYGLLPKTVFVSAHIFASCLSLCNCMLQKHIGGSSSLLQSLQLDGRKLMLTLLITRRLYEGNCGTYVVSVLYLSRIFLIFFHISTPSFFLTVVYIKLKLWSVLLSSKSEDWKREKVMFEIRNMSVIRLAQMLFCQVAHFRSDWRR